MAEKSTPTPLALATEALNQLEPIIETAPTPDLYDVYTNVYLTVQGLQELKQGYNYRIKARNEFLAIHSTQK